MKKLAIVLVGILMIGAFISWMLPQNTVNAASIVSISVCQAGYSADSLKTAVAVVTGGTLSDTAYQIVKAGDGTQVVNGTMTAYTPSGWTRGETYYKIDFSAFTQTGDFKIVTNGVSSTQFTVAENIWTNYTDEMVEFYRLQRCGVDTNTALPSGFTNRPSSEALHTACHVDDAKKGSESGANADMTGAWHDAGDNNKYAGNMGWVTGALALSFLRHPNATFDYDSNGVPDLLDEARFGAESLLKVQAAAGMNGAIYDTIDAPNGQQYSWKYPSAETNGVRGDSDDRVGHSRSGNTFTYDGAMKTAGSLAAVARAFASRDAAFSNRCKTGAVGAYNWALSNTNMSGGFYGISDQNNSRLWAAVQLYRLTNETTYGSWINTYINGLNSINSKPTNYWSLQPVALAEYYPVAGTLQSKIITLLTNHINVWKNNLVAPFGVTWQNNDGSFGINEPNMSYADDAIRLYEITGDASLRDAAVSALQWTFGVNPWANSWVSGIGTKYTAHLHSRLDADGDSNASSTIKLPGYMVCGSDWSDPLNSNSTHPWYEDRALALDSNQWRYNEFSISIQYGLVDVIVALSCDGGTPTPTPTPVATATPVITATPTPVRTPTPVISTPTPVIPTPTSVRTATPAVATPTPVIATPTPVRTATPAVSTPTPGTGNYVVIYTMNDWGSGATVSITIINNSSTAVNGWTLAWDFPGNQTITNLWSGSYTQNGASVSVKDAGYNANIPAGGGTANFGFNINYSGTNAKPASFTLNGAACQVQ